MSNHEKAYLICENKCMVEGIPKGNIVVVTGQLESVPPRTALAAEINYSDIGFSATDKLVFLSVMQTTDSNGVDWSDSVVGSASEYQRSLPSIRRLDGYQAFDVTVFNQAYSEKTIKYKVVVMKI